MLALSACGTSQSDRLPTKSLAERSGERHERWQVMPRDEFGNGTWLVHGFTPQMAASEKRLPPSNLSAKTLIYDVPVAKRTGSHLLVILDTQHVRMWVWVDQNEVVRSLRRETIVTSQGAQSELTARIGSPVVASRRSPTGFYIHDEGIAIAADLTPNELTKVFPSYPLATGNEVETNPWGHPVYNGEGAELGVARWPLHETATRERIVRDFGYLTGQLHARGWGGVRGSLIGEITSRRPTLPVGTCLYDEDDSSIGFVHRSHGSRLLPVQGDVVEIRTMGTTIKAHLRRDSRGRYQVCVSSGAAHAVSQAYSDWVYWRR